MRNILLITVLLSIFGCTLNNKGYSKYNYIIEDYFVIEFKESKEHKIYLEYPQPLIKNGNTIVQKLVGQSIKIYPTFNRRFKREIGYKIIKERKYGNRFIYIKIPKSIAQHLIKLEVTAQYKLLRQAFDRNSISIPDTFIRDIDTKKMRKYLVSERFAPLNEYYLDLSRRITRNDKSDFAKLHSLYTYVAQHGKYYKIDPAKLKPSGRGDANYCDKLGTGGCSDYHAYFQSITRAQNIPTRLATGTYLNPKYDGKNEDNGYHCWVEVYIPTVGWVPLDPSWGNYFHEKLDYYFLNLEKERVLFVYGRNFFLPYSNYFETLFKFATILQKNSKGNYTKSENYTRKLRFWSIANN